MTSQLNTKKQSYWLLFLRIFSANFNGPPVNKGTSSTEHIILTLNFNNKFKIIKKKNII